MQGARSLYLWKSGGTRDFSAQATRVCQGGSEVSPPAVAGERRLFGETPHREVGSSGSGEEGLRLEKACFCDWFLSYRVCWTSGNVLDPFRGGPYTEQLLSTSAPEEQKWLIYRAMTIPESPC